MNKTMILRKPCLGMFKGPFSLTAVVVQSLIVKIFLLQDSETD